MTGEAGAVEQVVNYARAWKSHCQHPGAVTSWSVLGSCPCSHPVSLHKGETIQRGKFLAAVRRGKGVPAGLARVTYVLIVYFEALATRH